MIGETRDSVTTVPGLPYRDNSGLQVMADGSVSGVNPEPDSNCFHEGIVSHFYTCSSSFPFVLIGFTLTPCLLKHSGERRFCSLF